MQHTEYFATLCARNAEFKALRHLSGPAKNNITPVFLLAPWRNTSPLGRALHKFEEAWGDQPYLVDVDTYYRPSDNESDAKEQWRRLAFPPADLELWHEILAEHPLANPCLQIQQQSVDAALGQVEWARENDRSFCLRFNMAAEFGQGIPDWIEGFVGWLVRDGAADYAIIFDFGWVRDPLTVSATATGYVRNLFAELGAHVPICISCTSFPKDFTVYDGLCEEQFGERQLLENVVRNTNHPRMVFGDWGSTRPRSYGHARQPKTRIDYPLSQSWVFARGQNNEVSFRDAASRIVNSRHWTGGLNVWGEQLMQATAEEEDYSIIDTMPEMYAARVNMHLHRQAFYGSDLQGLDLDEDWEDI